MIEKYIELADRMKRGHGDDEVLEGIDYALRWLDDHPDQVPGRTITESECRFLYDEARRGPAFFGVGLVKVGITVAPDPEPTNAEKLESLFAELMKRQMTYKAAGEWLDEAGVKAPGGDE